MCGLVYLSICSCASVLSICVCLSTIENVLRLLSTFSLQRYRSNSQWTDGTIAYMFEIQQKLSASRTWEKCSLIDLESGIFEGFPLILISCGLHEGKAFICEKQLKVDSPTRLQIPVLTRNEEIQVSSYSMCPAGHVTRKFLSCDLQAACLWYHTSSMLFCGSSLLPPPPMFKCSSEMEQVPYPLVCDHRPDCRDFSDENFCVFRSCSGKSFHCGNKQVRSTHYWKFLENTQRILTISSKRHNLLLLSSFLFIPFSEEMVTNAAYGKQTSWFQ